MNFKFILAVAIMYGGFIVHFIFDEGLVSGKDGQAKYPYPTTLQFWSFLSNFLVAGLILLITRQKIPKNPLPYFKVAFFQFAGMLSTFYAKFHANYAAVSVLKSAKPAAVMVYNLILRKPIGKSRIISVSILTVGLIIFGFTGTAPSFKPLGAILCACSLMCDAIYVPIVDQLKTLSKSPYVVMFWAYFWSTIFTFVLNFAKIIESFKYLAENQSFIPKIFLFAITFSVAQVALYTALGLSDGLVVSIATTTRKFFTILLSAIIYKHSFTSLQWIGIVVVFIALGIEIAFKKKKQPVKKNDEKLDNKENTQVENKKEQ